MSDMAYLSAVRDRAGPVVRVGPEWWCVMGGGVAVADGRWFGGG
ncbi:hypothetical protein [Streptomyces sp. XM4193]|nr:hypothetical protein [Streptomyces sp. XM4193]